MAAALGEWRKATRVRDFQGTNFGKQAIMTDKVLQAIAKSSATVKNVDDFSRLNPSWPLAIRYGEEVLLAISEARDTIHERYRIEQQIRDQQQREERERKQRAGEIERERKLRERELKKLEKEAAKSRKEHNAKKRKWEQYEKRYAGGERRGNKPARPTPSPEPEGMNEPMLIDKVGEEMAVDEPAHNTMTV